MNHWGRFLMGTIVPTRDTSYKKGELNMEKIAIFSDVHANLTALLAVLEDIQKRGIHKIICLGDMIYKGVSPAETIDILREKCDVLLLGNCDEYMANEHAQEKQFWTRSKMGEERAEYIRSLPVFYEFYMSGYLIRLFHSSPFGLGYMYNPMYSNKNSKYASLELEEPERLFENTEFIGKARKDKEPDIVGYGHTHSPNIVRFKNKMIFNPGSVGMPAEMLNDSKKNETSKFSTVASYMILEGECGQTNLASINLQLIRVPYAIETEIRRIENSDYPYKEKLIQKLQTAEP